MRTSNQYYQDSYSHQLEQINIQSADQLAKIEIQRCETPIPEGEVFTGTCCHECKVTFMDGTSKNIPLSHESIYVLVQNIANEKFSGLEEHSHLKRHPVLNNREVPELPRIHDVVRKIFEFEELDISDMDNFLEELESETMPAQANVRYVPRWINGEYVLEEV